MGVVGGLVDLLGDTLDAVFEASETFAEAFAEFGQLFPAEQDNDDDARRTSDAKVVNISPICFSLQPGTPARTAHPLLSHKSDLLIDTWWRAKQMCAERYILVK